MRLSPSEALAIREIIRSYDARATVKLFGSQVDDSASGGDIDVLVFSREIDLARRVALEADLQDALGLRRFDVVVARDRRDPFVRLVEARAVEL